VLGERVLNFRKKEGNLDYSTLFAAKLEGKKKGRGVPRRPWEREGMQTRLKGKGGRNQFRGTWKRETEYRIGPSAYEEVCRGDGEG